MPRVLPRSVCSAVLVASALLGACRSDTTDLPAGRPAKVTFVAGGGQQAAVGTELAVTPTARVQDGNGTPVSGVVVRFTAAGGGGTVLGDSVITDAQGRASVGEWVMGTAPGTNTLRAAVDSTSVSATLTATAIPGNPVSIRPSGQQAFVGLVGQTVSPQPTVLVLDSYANPVPGASVAFAVTAGGGVVGGASVTTNAAGVAAVGTWTLGTGAGANQLTARISSGASFTFTAQALTVPPHLDAASSTTQSGYLDFSVTEIPRVRVIDADGNPLAGVPVTFAETSGDGLLTGGIAVSGNNGIAAPADWRLGSTSSSTVTAGMPIGTSQVSFTADGVPAPFRIDLRFIGTLAPDLRDAFVAAARRWMTIITAHLGAVTINLPAGTCITGQPALNETVEDVIIFADVEPIDGVGGVLGSAGPCAVRSGAQLTAVGSMHFDSADLNTLLINNQIVPTITHEMGHVLGFGTSWSAAGLTSGLGGSNPLFIGPGTLTLWPPFAGPLNYPGQPIPLENTGGAGTRDSHWRESVFHTELMTGWIEAPGVFMPLSVLTIGTMKDLGYQVNLDAADPFPSTSSPLFAAPSAGGSAVRLNEQLLAPRWEVSFLGSARRIR